MTSNLPLAGIKVVDFSRVLAGPHCGKTLLDLGADVVKFEPPGGDIARRAFPNDGGVSGYYAQQNAGKRNLSVDLTVPGATEVVLRLCDKADVIVENFRPGALAAFGLDYESVAARNPRVVYASISGYGQHGPWRSRMARSSRSFPGLAFACAMNSATVLAGSDGFTSMTNGNSTRPATGPASSPLAAKKSRCRAINASSSAPSSPSSVLATPFTTVTGVRSS